MKRLFILPLILIPMVFGECKADKPSLSSDEGNADSKVVLLSDANFKKMIFNYEVNNQWKFEGKKPAIIDFYADWCAPCRQVSPVVEELALEYDGKIDVYKVDTEQEKALAEAVGITALPTILFIPAKGEPQVVVGAVPKEHLVNAIKEILLIN